MDWAREIARQFQGRKTIEPEVLELLIPSDALMNLRLPAEILYEHCRWSVRDLLRRIHPDSRGGNVIPALQQLSDAFDSVKDPSVFVEALTNARERRALRRRGENVLHERIRSLEETIAHLRQRMKDQEAAHQEEVTAINVRWKGNVTAAATAMSEHEVRKRMAKMKEEHTKEVQKLTQEYRVRVSKRNANLQSRLAEARAKLASQAKRYQQRIRGLKGAPHLRYLKTFQRMKDLEAKHKKRVNELNASCKIRIALLNAKHKQQIKTLAAAHKEQMRELRKMLKGSSKQRSRSDE